MPTLRELDEQLDAQMANDILAEYDPPYEKAHYLPVRADRPDHELFVIAANEHVAVILAELILANVLPRVYLFGCDCLAAWRALPSFQPSAYHPYRVEVREHPRGFLEIASSRLDRPEGRL